MDQTVKFNVMLANVYNPDTHDVTGWYLSKKRDGMRGFWYNGEMYSRNKNKISIPKWFVEDFPDINLDGELDAGDGNFKKTAAARKKVAVDSDWEQIRYVVFDIPNLLLPYKDRLKLLKELCSKCKYITVIEDIICLSHEHLIEYFNQIVKEGGEGVMARSPNSKNVNRRSNDLLKIKSFFDDEAHVIAYEEGTGKYVGKVGALICKLTRNGKEIIFNVGTGLKDYDREYTNIPPIGSVITFKHYGFDPNDPNGSPRHPVFLRIRED